MTKSQGLPLSYWLSLERRLTRAEMEIQQHGKQITDLEGKRQQVWNPRDYLLSAAGLALVAAAAAEKVPWSVVHAFFGQR